MATVAPAEMIGPRRGMTGRHPVKNEHCFGKWLRIASVSSGAVARFGPVLLGVTLPHPALPIDDQLPRDLVVYALQETPIAQRAGAVSSIENGRSGAYPDKGFSLLRQCGNA